ncbi:hypothetical protein Tco_0989455 [Tanacetum coccineum]|uniref:Uncharacterized protein n=1 Tax=Tanacetum coccineum TaxID=301880 RepID=A0ABQ5ETR5_9ASTR
MLTFVVGQIVPAFMKELICKVLGLLVPLLELNRFGILLSELGEGRVVSSVIGGILSIEARDMDTKLLSAPESNNTLAKCWFRRNVPVASSGWPFVLAVFGLMTHLVTSLTLDNARSCVMQGASFTQGKASSIPIVFSWGGSISPDGFLPSILLLVVIIVAVVIVVITVILVVVGEVSSKVLAFEAVTFPSILLGNPPMKTSMSFSEFGTIIGHKTANS